jgi:predicted dehydrogenase
MSSSENSRRDFVRSAASAAALTLTPGYVAGADAIRVGMIGAGGRCTEAATQALTADDGARLVAIADIVPERLREKRKLIQDKFPKQVEVPDNRLFAGYDAYQHVIANSDVVLIANAAKFHPMHMMAAIQAGKHVFVEKPHAIDPAGIKVVTAACELARQKNLSVLSGLQSRYTLAYRETIQRIHDGAIGDVLTIEENFLRPPYVLYPRLPGLTEVEWQGSNQYHFHWLSGDDVPQSLVHNLDRTSWVLRGQSPIKCHGMGGRSTLRGEIYGSTFDHHAVVYEFPNNVRVYAFCRTIPGCYNETSSIVHGTKGRALVLRGVIEGEKPWKYAGPGMYASSNTNPYQIEHNELFKAIRAGKPLNSGDYMTRSTMIGIMGQISCYTGKEVTWEQVNASDFYYAPKPEDVRADMEAPVKPDAEGIYPVYIPGVTKLI